MDGRTACGVGTYMLSVVAHHPPPTCVAGAWVTHILCTHGRVTQGYTGLRQRHACVARCLLYVVWDDRCVHSMKNDGDQQWKGRGDLA